MTDNRAAINLKIYERADTVRYYAMSSGLQDCESLVFARHLRPHQRVLDLGVGGGRTTPYLSMHAASYVGVDASAAMIAECRRAYPDLEFIVADAADMSGFSDSSFDAIVFSFNGLDYLVPATQRWACLSECHRLLSREGLFIFSVHNPRGVVVRPPLKGVTVKRRIWRVVRATGKTLGNIQRFVTRRALWKGDGYVRDPTHGGLITRYSIPKRVIAETSAAGFELLDVIPGPDPRRRLSWITPWYYYVFCRE